MPFCYKQRRKWKYNHERETNVCSVGAGCCSSLHFSMLFWLELQGTLICARKRSRIRLKTRKVKRLPPVLVIMLVLEKKRAASRASYRADPEEKRAASRVASHASCLAYHHVFLYLKLTFDRAACSGLLVSPDS